jgi:hypothetical protein
MTDIQNLIVSGQTEEALEALSSISNHAAVLQERFKKGMEDYRKGSLGFKEWSEMKGRINYEALEVESFSLKNKK